MHRLALLTLLLAGCAAASTQTQSTTGRNFARRAPEIPIGNCAEIAPGLFRSAQPDLAGLEALAARGFKTVLNLRSHHSERAEAIALGLTVVEVPLQADLFGSEPPTEAQLKRLFDVLLDPTSRPLVFHCAHGADRTGTLAALYRIEVDGWTNDEAIEELQAFGFHNIYADLINYVRAYKRRGFTAPKRLLVVAPEKWHPLLADFIRFKRSLLPAELVSLEAALKTDGADDAERLKRYLYSRRAETGYVLLVGDGDVLPVRFMVLDRVTKEAFDTAFYPSDLYYADLCRSDGSFDDWNATRGGFHAGYFGEVRGEKNKGDAINFDGVDYRPDVAVGRWPVSTDEELKTVVTKSIAWEKSVERRRAAFFMVGGWVDVRDWMKELARKLPDSAVRLYGGKPGPTEKELISLVNDGAGLVLHAGHGSDWTWEGCFSANSIKSLKRTAVFVSAGCSTARFVTLPPYEGYIDAEGREHKGSNAGELFTAPPPPPACYQRGAHNPSGLGEQLVRGGPTGAVAYIGCNTGSQPCGLSLLEGFVIAAAESRDGRIGDWWSRAVAYYYDKEKLSELKPTADWYPPSIFFQGMKFMLFGDPSLRIP